jgi:hypothetical protein
MQVENLKHGIILYAIKACFVGFFFFFLPHVDKSLPVSNSQAKTNCAVLKY